MSCFSRESYVAHPYDDEFENTIDDILGEGDVDKFHKYVEVFEDNYDYPALLDMALDRRSLDCALHIIQGKLPHGPPNLAADHVEPTPDLPVLYQAIRFMCEPSVFHLLLYDCKAANQVNQPYCGVLPIHLLLDLFEKIPPLPEWSPRKPLSELIASLFLPQVRTKLECARMLAQHTYSLDQVALGYILNGEIIPLAALLLVAPFTKGDFETIKSYTSSIASEAIRDQSVTPTFCAAAALVNIFDKDGDKLTSTFNNEHEPAGMIAEISTSSDIYSNSSSHSEMLQTICERLGSIKIDDKTQISRKSPFPSMKMVRERGQI